MALSKVQRRERIKKRVRKVITGTAERPRLTVFRSNKQIYAQIIDDISGKTLSAAASIDKQFSEKKFENKNEQSSAVGELVAKRAIESGIKEVVFDRNGYLYHGRIKSLADGARKGGLKF